MGSNRDF